MRSSCGRMWQEVGIGRVISLEDAPARNAKVHCGSQLGRDFNFALRFAGNLQSLKCFESESWENKLEEALPCADNCIFREYIPGFSHFSDNSNTPAAALPTIQNSRSVHPRAGNDDISKYDLFNLFSGEEKLFPTNFHPHVGVWFRGGWECSRSLPLWKGFVLYWKLLAVASRRRCAV